MTAHTLQLIALALLSIAVLAVLFWPQTAAEKARDRARRRANIRWHLLTVSERVGASVELRRDLQPYLDSYAEAFCGRVEAGTLDIETAEARIRGHADWLMRPEGATATAARIGAEVTP